MKFFQIVATAVVALLLLSFVGIAAYRLISPEIAAPTTGSSSSLPASAFTPTPTMPECPDKEATEFVARLDTLVSQWDDALALANTTQRATLSPMVDTMQRIRRDTGAMQPPACGLFLNELLIASMNDNIDAFLIFMQRGQQYDSQKDVSDSLIARSIFNTYLPAFRANPLAGYKAAYAMTEIAPPFQSNNQWISVRMVKNERPIFSLPAGWDLYPSDSIDKIAIKDKSETIKLTLEKNKPIDLTILTPPAALVEVASQYALNGKLQTLAQGNFGDNAGYLVSSSGDKLFQIGGEVQTPDKTAYWFNAIKQDTSFTSDEESLIKQIVSSIRLAD